MVMTAEARALVGGITHQMVHRPHRGGKHPPNGDDVGNHHLLGSLHTPTQATIRASQTALVLSHSNSQEEALLPMVLIIEFKEELEPSSYQSFQDHILFSKQNATPQSCGLRKCASV